MGSLASLKERELNAEVDRAMAVAAVHAQEKHQLQCKEIHVLNLLSHMGLPSISRIRFSRLRTSASRGPMQRVRIDGEPSRTVLSQPIAERRCRRDEASDSSDDRGKRRPYDNLSTSGCSSRRFVRLH